MGAPDPIPILVAEPAGTLQGWALAYAEIGWHVLPLKPRTKEPLGRLVPNAARDATTDAETIRRWWRAEPEANIGIAVEKSGLLVIDVDPRNGGEATFDDLQAEHADLRSDVMAFTGGKPTGLHHVFAAPTDVQLHPRGKLGAGVDVKHNGYIVVEPSIHPSGKQYGWEASSNPLDGVAPSPLPDWLRRTWTERAQPAVQAGANVVDKKEAVRVRSALWTLDAEDYEQWLRAGMALHATGWGAAAFGMWVDWACQSDKFDAQASRKKWDSFHGGRAGSVTLGSVFAEAKSCGWVDPAAQLLASPDGRPEPPPEGEVQDAPAAARRTAQILDFAALAGKKAPERPWVRPGWLGFEPTLVAGAGGSGKSGLMQHEATCGALGRAYFAPECEPYTSLVWNCEDAHDDLWRRQERICEHEGIDMADLAGRLHIVSRYGCDNALMADGAYGVLGTTRLLEELRQQVNDLHVTGLYLDNAAHLLIASHDDRTTVTAFINALAGLVVGRPFFFVIAGHTARMQGSEFSGSAAWENAVRMRWFLGTQLPDQKAEEGDEPRTDVRFLCKRKSNYSAQDYVRFTMRDGLLVPDQKAQTHVGGLVAVLDGRKAEEVCIAGFRSLCAIGIRTTDGRTSSDYLPTQLVAKGFAAGYSKSEIGKAMNRLMGRGVFVRAQVDKHANRTPKFGLVLNDEGSS